MKKYNFFQNKLLIVAIGNLENWNIEHFNWNNWTKI